MKTPKKPRYVKTIVPLGDSKVEIYAGSRVGNALKAIEDLDIFKGAKVIDLVEAAYEQGKKDGARNVRDSFEEMMADIPHKNPGRPKLRHKKKSK